VATLGIAYFAESTRDGVQAFAQRARLIFAAKLALQRRDHGFSQRLSARRTQFARERGGSGVSNV
jgi:hypothetical protein